MSSRWKCLKCGEMGHIVKECKATPDKWLESYKKYVADLKAKKAAGGTQPAPGVGGASQRPGTQPPVQTSKGGAAVGARAMPGKSSQMPKTPAEDPGVLGKRVAEGEDPELGPDAGLRDLDATEAAAAGPVGDKPVKARGVKRPKLGAEHLGPDSKFGLQFVYDKVSEQYRAKYKAGRVPAAAPTPSSLQRTASDLRRLLEVYQGWQRLVFPYTDLDTFFAQMEKIGSSYALRMRLREIRSKVHEIIPSRKVREAEAEGGRGTAQAREEAAEDPEYVPKRKNDDWGEESDGEQQPGARGGAHRDREAVVTPGAGARAITQHLADGDLFDSPGDLRDLLGGDGNGSELPALPMDLGDDLEFDDLANEMGLDLDEILA